MNADSQHNQASDLVMNQDNSGDIRANKNYGDSTGGSGAFESHKVTGHDRGQRTRDGLLNPVIGGVYEHTNIGTPIQMIPTNTSGCRGSVGPLQGKDSRPLAAVSFRHRQMFPQFQQANGRDLHMNA